MKFKHLTIVAALLAAAFTMQAENLLTAPASVYLDSRPGVKCVQDKKANTQKLTVEKYAQDSEGNLCISATLYYGGMAGDSVPGRGIAAEPGAAYTVSFEYRGDVPRFWFGAQEYTGVSFWKDRKLLKKMVLTPSREEWKKAECTVVTGANCQRFSFYVNLYINEKDNLFDLKEGQSLQIRNAVIEKK